MDILTTTFPSLLAMSPGDAIFVALPVVGCMLLSYGIYQIVADSRRDPDKRLKERLRGESSQKPDKALENILRRGAFGEKRTFADAIVGKLSFTTKLQTMLDQADIPWSASQTLLNLTGIAILAAMGLAMLQFSPIVALGSAAGVFLLPLMAINFLRKRRVGRLTNQLPDVFELMSQALRAGHALPSAIQLVQEQMPAPIATEFGMVYQEQNLGMKIEDALLEMANRVDSLDVRFFVTAVLIQRSTGGDLAEVLDKIGGLIRQRIELVGMVKGLTGEGRLSGWVLFALPFIVLGAILTLNPDYGNTLFDEPSGRMLLMIAGGMQLMGLAMIRWIVNIKI